MSESQICPNMLEPCHVSNQVDSQQSPRSGHHPERPEIEVDEVVVISVQVELPNEFGKVVISDISPMTLVVNIEVIIEDKVILEAVEEVLLVPVTVLLAEVPVIIVTKSTMSKSSNCTSSFESLTMRWQSVMQKSEYA